MTNQNSNSDNDEIQKHEFLLEMIKRYDHYIATSNFKIGLLMSFVMSVLVGFLIYTTKVYDSTFEAKGVMIFLVTAIAVLSLLVMFYLTKAVSPYTKTRLKVPSLIFFGDVANFKSGEDYKMKVNELDNESMIEDLSHQAYELANVANIKMKYISTATGVIKILIIPYTITLVTFSYFALN